MEIYLHQVGGHSRDKFMLMDEGRKILKPMHKLEAFDREVRFYNELFQASTTIQHFCKFYGLIWLKFDDTRPGEVTEWFYQSTIDCIPYMILENLTANFTTPGIIDIKIGRQTYEPGAPISKIEYEHQKFPMQKELGFRITGMKIFDSSDGTYMEVSKHICRAYSPGLDILSALGLYFYDRHSSYYLDILSRAVQLIEDVVVWATSQCSYNFYASSLLIVCDFSQPFSNLNPRLRLIDFAHVVNISCAEEKDNGFIFGLRSLLEHVRKIADILGSEAETDQAGRNEFHFKVAEKYQALKGWNVS